MPLFIRHFLLPGFAMLALAGCQSGREEESLRGQVTELASKLDSLIVALEMQRENDSIAIDESILVLTPGDSDAYIRTKVGYLTARVDSFRDFGSGSRTTFWFGNLGSASLRGMRARLEWKVRTERGDTQFQAPVLYEFLEELKPGKLTPVRVLIDDIPSARLIEIRISRIRFQEIVFTAK
jgi:hypothetical protein